MWHTNLQPAQIINSLKTDLIFDLKTLLRHGTTGLRTSRKAFQHWIDVRLQIPFSKPTAYSRSVPRECDPGFHREQCPKVKTSRDVTSQLQTETCGGQLPGDLSSHNDSQVKAHITNQFTIIPLNDLKEFYAIHDAEGKTVGSGSRETCELLVHILSKDSRVRESINSRPSLTRNDNIRAAILM